MSDSGIYDLGENTPKAPDSTVNLSPQDQESKENAMQSMAAQINVPKEKLDALGNWLYESLFKAQSDRSELSNNLVEWERAYEAIPKNKIKDFPWPGCSNLVVPVIPTAVESIFSRIINVVFGGKQLWLPQAVASHWADVIEPLGTWINNVGKNTMKMYRTCQDWFLGALKFGTGIMKLTWDVDQRHFVYKDSTGTIVDEDHVTFEGPRPLVISLADFLVSPDGHLLKDVQSMEWVAHRVSLTAKQLKERELSGVYMNVDQLIGTQEENNPTTMEQQKLDEVGVVSPRPMNTYEIWEVWCSYDIDGDGKLEELVCNYNMDKQVMLRAVYNFYKHQERPFHVIRYMQREGSFYGIGIPEMLMMTQEEITTMHNQRLDNGTVANSKVFLRQRDSNVGDLDIYPGAQIDVERTGPEGDVTALDMGRDHATLLEEEQITNGYGEKRTGVSDYTTGRQSSAIGSRATATSTLALIREGNKRFQMVIMDIRETLANVAHQVIALYQQFKPNGLPYEMFSDKEQKIMQAFFDLPDEYTRANIIVDIPALSDIDNKDVAKQALLTLMQVLTQYYQQLFQAFQMALSPQAPEPVRNLAITGAKAASKLMERIIEAFDFRDPDSFTADIDALLGLEEMAQDMANIGGQSGNTQPAGSGQPSGPASQLGMGGAMQGIGAAPTGSTGQAPGSGPTPGTGSGQAAGAVQGI